MSKRNLKKLIVLVPAALFAISAMSAEEESVLREKLFPIVERTLQEHCGSDCPSFRIDPQFQNPAGGQLDDLGFAHVPQNDQAPALKSVSVAVLVSDKVSQSAKDSLKQIVALRLGNEVGVPVSVQLKPLAAVSPVMDHIQDTVPVAPPTAVLDFIKPIAWPLSIIILGVLGFLGLILFFRHQLKLFREKSEIIQARIKSEKANAQNSALSAHTYFEAAKGMLMERSKDLQWLIEERASHRDSDALGKIVAIFPAQELTLKLQLSELALSSIAHIVSGPSKKETDFPELMAWISKSLDRAHWKRIEEERMPLMKLDRLSEEQLAEAFVSLPTLSEKAVMVSSISKERWPHLLTRVGSDERIQLGLLLAQYQKASPANRRVKEAALMERVSEILEKSFGMQEGVLEDFTLYLPEKEGQKLWQELSIHSHSIEAQSVDSLLQKLEPAALLEICMSVEVSTLKALLPTVSSSTRTRVMEALPKVLRLRLLPGLAAAGLTTVTATTTADGKNEAVTMKARAEFISAYRKFQAKA